MNELRIYWEESVLYSNVTNYFSVGYIDSIGRITDISISPNLAIIILEPDSYTLTKNANNSGLDAIAVSPSDTNITLAIKLIYNTSPLTNITQVLSYTLVPQINLLNQNDIQLLISRILPPNVYNVGINSTVYPRLYGIANTLISLYQTTNIDEITSIFNFIDSIYPINGDPSWEITLEGTQSLLYQSTGSQYGQLLQHIYATTINNDNNPYYYAFNISKFIALLLYNINNDDNTPSQYYVALNENKANINKAFIIANNSIDNVILSETNNVLQLNINIFPINLSSNFPASWQQNIINQYIRRITRCAVNPLISYGPTPMLLPTSYLGDTYWGDIRQLGTYCIAYNPGILEQAIGYVLPLIAINEVENVTFQISSDGIAWTDFTTPSIQVIQDVPYRLRLTLITINQAILVPNASPYGQFYIGNNGYVTDITVTYNPNAPDNDSYFIIIFNITGSISVNAYGLWFNQVGTFIVVPQASTRAFIIDNNILDNVILAEGSLLPVTSVTFQISSDGIAWTDFTTPNIPVTQGVLYKLRATALPSTININGSPYGQFYIGNNGKVTDIRVNYNPNATDNNKYFTIVFNITGNISINAYGLWFNQVGTFIVT